MSRSNSRTTYVPALPQRFERSRRTRVYSRSRSPSSPIRRGRFSHSRSSSRRSYPSYGSRRQRRYSRSRSFSGSRSNSSPSSRSPTPARFRNRPFICRRRVRSAEMFPFGRPPPPPVGYGRPPYLGGPPGSFPYPSYARGGYGTKGRGNLRGGNSRMPDGSFGMGEAPSKQKRGRGQTSMRGRGQISMRGRGSFRGRGLPFARRGFRGRGYGFRGHSRGRGFIGRGRGRGRGFIGRGTGRGRGFRGRGRGRMFARMGRMGRPQMRLMLKTHLDKNEEKELSKEQKEKQHKLSAWRREKKRYPHTKMHATLFNDTKRLFSPDGPYFFSFLTKGYGGPAAPCERSSRAKGNSSYALPKSVAKVIDGFQKIQKLEG